MLKRRFTTIAVVIGTACLLGAATAPDRERCRGEACLARTAAQSGEDMHPAGAISIPLWFEPVGDEASGPDARFVARRSGFEMVVDGRGAQLHLPASPAAARRADGDVIERARAMATSLSVEFPGANPDVEPRAERPLPGVTHYYIGNDPARWRTHVPQFGAVRLPAIYDGIDVVFYGNPSALEYDVIVAPGVDPSVARFRLRGADAVSLAGDGGLVAEIGGRHVVQRRPVAYQDIEGARVPVDARYLVRGDEGDEIGFEVGEYDTTRPLVIDPVVIVYGTFLGGSASEFAGAPSYFGGGIVADSSGNLYVVGETDSTQIGPATATATQTGLNVFVARLNAAGSALAFVTYIGGSSQDEGGAIALDASGNIWVAGNSWSTNLPQSASGLIQSGPHVTLPEGPEDYDAFVARLTAAGTLNYLSYVGGSNSDTVEAIATSGNRAILAGSTRSTDSFPKTANALQPANAGLLDAWVVVVDPFLAPASWLSYGSYFGGADDDYGLGAAVDSAGRVVLSGQTFSPSAAQTATSPFPTTTGALQTSLVGAGPDAFVARFAIAGTTWSVNYSTYFGGNGSDDAKVAIGPGDSIYLAGRTSSNNLPAVAGSSPAQPSIAGGTDGYVARISPQAGAGSAQLVYRTYLGGSALDVPLSIYVDAAGRAYVTGHTLSTSATFPVVEALSGHTNLSGDGTKEDAFVTRVNPAGTAFEFSTYLGGTARDMAMSVTSVTGFGTFVLGLTESATPFTLQSQGGAAIDNTLGGTRDAFVVRISETGNPPFISTVAPGSGPAAGGTTITITGTGFLTGASVTIDGKLATSPNVVNATSITAVTPAGSAGLPKDVRVTNPDEQSFTKTGAFTYVPPPGITSLSPNSGPASGGTTITVTGSNFVSGAAVAIGTTVVNATFVGASTLTAVTPAGSAGTRDVTVTNPDGQSATVSKGFTYTSSVPALSSIAPNSGPIAGGTPVTISGANLQSPATVTIGGASAVVTSVTPSAITATTPAGTAGARDVVVTTGGVTLTLTSAFLYVGADQPAPTLASITPNSGSAVGGQSVTLTGTSFLTGATVTFGINSATNVTVVSTTTITATTPANSAGTFTVVVTNTDGKSSTQAVAYTFATDSDGDGMPDSWEQQYTACGLSSSNPNDKNADPDGDSTSNQQEFNDSTDPCNAVLRYFAEGATINVFSTRFALLNYDQTRTANVTLQFLTNLGNVITKSMTIPPKTRATVLPKTEVPGMAAAQFSTVVKSNIPVAADRTMTWDSTTYGAHAETAILAPASTWYLAEGATTNTFNLFYLLQNPNDVDTQVTVRYLLGSGAPVQKTYELPKKSRQNIWVNFETVGGVSLNRQELSAEFTTAASTPIIVERAMYADVPGQSFGAGHEAAAVTAPATSWYLAEGATGAFNLFILVANANDVTANVAVTYLLPGGNTVLRNYQFGPNSRSNIWVNLDQALANTAVSTVLSSDVPVIVERAMWWGNSDGWFEAHASPGITSTATRWALAEGEVGPPGAPDTYILIANTSNRSGTARVTLFFDDGTAPLSQDYPLDPNSRTNVLVGVTMGNASLGGKKFGAVIESLGSSPVEIVVERAMYWNSGSQFYAAGTNSVGTPLVGGRQ